MTISNRGMPIDARIEQDVHGNPSLKRMREDDEIDRNSYRADMHIDTPEAMPAVQPDVVVQKVPKWQQATEASFNGIVSIRFSQPIAFDTEQASCANATGFIVDAQRGIILTNRHVVGAGPFVGEAIMHDHEVIEVRALYRDPIHDFGFLKFDPSHVKYMKLVEIPLAPENAQVGIDVRIIGNDAGEKLSILTGSISRIDRNVPDYGSLSYNDLNTFYLQSAASLSGGSSGSPVIDIYGAAVGLQAGGRTKEATNYFLPLDRVKRALELIQKGEPVLRGTIHTRFKYASYDIAQKLGLPEEIEAAVRRGNPAGVGMLIIASVLPEGPGEQAGLEEGDILLQINGKLVTHFVTLEEILDSHIGSTIDVVVNRGGKDIKSQVLVEDMHKFTPTRLVTVGSCVLHDFSYQLAYSCKLPPRGVFMTSRGQFEASIDEESGYIVEKVDGKPVSNIDEFVKAIQKIGDMALVPLDIHCVIDTHTKMDPIVFISHQWQPINVYTMNSTTGLWDHTRIKWETHPLDANPVNLQLQELEDTRAHNCKDLALSIVIVRGLYTLSLECVSSTKCASVGFVVDAERGLVVVSRWAIELSACAAMVVFGNSLSIPAKVRFLHPTHNFAIVQYDPKRIGKNNIKQITVSKKPIKVGDPACMVTIGDARKLTCINTAVSDTHEFNGKAPFIPTWRCINTEVISYESALLSRYLAGIIGDEDGQAQSIWVNFPTGTKKSFSGGLPARYILPALEALQQGEEPRVRSLGIEVSVASLLSARTRGLSESRLEEFQAALKNQTHIFYIARVEILSKAHGVLKDLDIIISINGKLMLHIDDLEVQNSHDFLEMVILRDKQEMTLRVETTEYDGGDNKVIKWCGATFQAPYMGLRLQSSVAHSGVVCVACDLGSPAEQYGMHSLCWITHVNGIKTPDIDTFEKVVRSCPDNKYTRVRYVSFFNEPDVLAIKTFYHYWPTSTLIKDPSSASGWRSSED
ncbi:hypothetical protein H4R22_003885 [Coemansia sp. RSA 1290]|nr:hypothetical protein H4R22_003885 [Coemansia sp. RSA 1290]